MWIIVMAVYNAQYKTYGMVRESQEDVIEELRKRLVTTEHQEQNSRDSKYKDKVKHVIHINLDDDKVTRYVPDMKTRGGKFMMVLVEHKEEVKAVESEAPQHNS